MRWCGGAAVSDENLHHQPHLTTEEAEYILNDSGAKALITSTGLQPAAGDLATRLSCQVMLKSTR